MDAGPELLAEPGRIERPRPERPTEGPALDGGVDARGAGMQPRAPSGKSGCGIHRDPAVARDHPHE